MLDVYSELTEALIVTQGDLDFTAELLLRGEFLVWTNLLDVLCWLHVEVGFVEWYLNVSDVVVCGEHAVIKQLE